MTRPEADALDREIRDVRSSMSWLISMGATVGIIGGGAFIYGSFGWGVFFAAGTVFILTGIFRQVKHLQKLEELRERL
jgi:hypothetical protein